MTLAALAKAVASNRLLPWCVANCRKRKPDEVIAARWARSTLLQRIKFHDELGLTPIPWSLAYCGPISLIDTAPRPVQEYRLRYGSDGSAVVVMTVRGTMRRWDATVANDCTTMPPWRLVGCDPVPFARLLEVARDGVVTR